MEATTFDESMEMAPDTAGYFDNHDDIEIELDGLGAPNHDEDVVVDDASMAGSDHPGRVGDDHEPVKDADMIDDEFHEDGGGHKEAEDDYQFIDDALDIDHQSYEMEEDYEEDIDAPIPGTSVMEPDVPVHEVPSAEMPEEYSAPETQKGKDVETNIQAASAEENASLAPKEESDEVHISPQVAQQPEFAAQDSKTELECFDNEGDQPLKTETIKPQELNHEVEAQTEASAPETVDEAAKEKVSTSQGETERDESQLSALHNVQVLYQDSEISLFPPKEDDLSETYFLEDEALAHEPIGDLLNACRLVLGDHMGKEEELFMEIDCLGLHLTEAIRSHITLAQIVQVYLDLSRNDGDTNPGPLYMSLATQPTFTQNFNSISEAAQAGKGLSHVGKWEEYEDHVIFEEDGNTGDSSQVEGQEASIEPVEKSESRPATPLREPGNEHEEVSGEETGANEGLESNTKEIEEQYAPSAPAEDPATANIEMDKPEPEPEHIVHDNSGTDGGIEQDITEQDTDLGQAEEPTHEDVQEEDGAHNEEAKSPVPGSAQNTNTEPTNQAAAPPNTGEEFIEIDLETFGEEELHDDEGLVDEASYEQVAEPSTPEPTYNPLEADEDIFKSPTAPAADAPHESPEGRSVGTSEEAPLPAETRDEYTLEASIPGGQNGDTSKDAATPVVDQTRDFNPEQDVDSANGEAQLELHPEFELDTNDLTEKDGEDIFADSAALEVDWRHDTPKDPDVVDLEETPQTEIFHGHDLEPNALAENNGEFAELPSLEDGSNEIAQNGSASQEQSPKAAKRPRADEEPNGLSNPVPVMKKHRSD
ncbi:hypothetical protein FQN49_003823 [Arthroderma sp. PD_2]|nr:hypothetical protein FQN49_003823 [Arthroderma sp. PD_2]